MKKASFIAVTSLAAAVASSSSSDSRALPPFDNESLSQLSSSTEAGSGLRREREGDKFAPRFDGLRFIETLVTAHR